MQHNILNTGRVAKILLIFTLSSGIRRREAVQLRYMGDKDFYFSGEFFENFAKPKNKSLVEIRVYTPEGLYKAVVKILDTTLSMNEVLYQLELPKTWDFVQMRVGSRKNVKLPGVLKFNDGEELSFETHDLSVGGFSFYTDKPIPSIYQRFDCELSMEFPNNLIINFPDRKLMTRAKFVRSDESPKEFSMKYFYALKFVQLVDNDKIILKNYLLNLE